MMRHGVESIMAAVVLAVAGFFLAFALSHGGLPPPEGYVLTARFTDAGGLAAGNAVRLGGVRVGTVEAVSIDPASFQAVVRFSLRRNLHLPDDTVARIASRSPLGGKVLSLSPGTSRRTVPPGGRLVHTRAFVSLEQSVGRQIFQSGLGPLP